MHRRRCMIDFFLVPVSRLHLKSVRICWYGSSIFCGDGSDLILVYCSTHGVSRSWRVSSWPELLRMGSWLTKGGPSPAALVLSPQNNVQRGKKRDQLGGPCSISPLGHPDCSYGFGGVDLSVAASRLTERQWGEHQEVMTVQLCGEHEETTWHEEDSYQG